MDIFLYSLATSVTTDTIETPILEECMLLSKSLVKTNYYAPVPVVILVWKNGSWPQSRFLSREWLNTV